MRRLLTLILTLLTAAIATRADGYVSLSLPSHELLPSYNVLYMMQDSEGCLWYATEGGGICRDNGIRMDVFRADAEHPSLLGSNKVGRLAEAGQYIIIGTFSGADVLDKRDFSIRHLSEVDDNRVDDILVTRDGRILLTANCKIYEFSADLQLKAVYPSQWQGRDVYVSHLYEDRRQRVWITQWGGGLLRLAHGRVEQMSWPLPMPPADVADDGTPGSLWVGTLGNGIVRYDIDNGTVEQQPETGNAVCIDLQLSADGRRLWMTTIRSLSLFDIGSQLDSLPTAAFMPPGRHVLNHLALDLSGQLLVAANEPRPFVVGTRQPQQWDGRTIGNDSTQWVFRQRQGLMAVSRATADERSVTTDKRSATADERLVTGSQRPLLPVIAPRADRAGIWCTDGSQVYSCNGSEAIPRAPVSEPPTALADDGSGNLWLSTGHDVRRLSMADRQETIVIADIPDVAAMAAIGDTLWMGTVYGQLLSYADGQLTVDDYASNELGDAITALCEDTLHRLVIVSDHYLRIYDPQRKTLRQQSRSDDGVYSICLQETLPGQRWSEPPAAATPQMPGWLTSWWFIAAVLLLLGAFIALAVYYFAHRKQRRRFIEAMRQPMTGATAGQPHTADDGLQPPPNPQHDKNEQWLQQVIAVIEQHLGESSYTVEQLGTDMCMSRMTFYRKIQTVTGQKPTEFMRTVRLRHAADMLRQGDLSVTEITYATGFASVSYFSRCFRAMYGVPPTQYKEQGVAE